MGIHGSVSAQRSILERVNDRRACRSHFGLEPGKEAVHRVRNSFFPPSLLEAQLMHMHNGLVFEHLRCNRCTTGFHLRQRGYSASTSPSSSPLLHCQKRCRATKSSDGNNNNNDDEETSASSLERNERRRKRRLS